MAEREMEILIAKLVDAGLERGISEGLDRGLDVHMRRFALRQQDYGLAMMVEERGAKAAFATVYHLAQRARDEKPRRG